MLHVTCDLCGKKLHPGEDPHFVVKVEVFAAHDPAGLTEDDLDEDHMEAFSEMLRELEECLRHVIRVCTARGICTADTCSPPRDW